MGNATIFFSMISVELLTERLLDCWREWRNQSWSGFLIKSFKSQFNNDNTSINRIVVDNSWKTGKCVLTNDCKLSQIQSLSWFNNLGQCVVPWWTVFDQSNSSRQAIIDINLSINLTALESKLKRVETATTRIWWNNRWNILNKFTQNNVTCLTWANLSDFNLITWDS